MSTCEEYNILTINVYIIVDLVKRDVLTLVGGIRRFINDGYLFLFLFFINLLKLA